MVVGAQFAQRCVELGGEEEHEQAGKESNFAAIVAKIEVIDIGEAEVNRDQRDRDSGEELQYGGAQKRKAQHFHGALAKIFRGVANGVTFSLGTHKELQGSQPLQTIEEVAGETSQRLKVAAVGIGGADTHQDHEDGDQRGSTQQDQARRPVDREHGHQNDYRNKDRDGHLRQIAGEEILHVFNLFQQQAGPAAGRATLDIGRTETA